jgi:uncharacterized BrkB/YihY/UPF0761 family membrane protein
VFELITREGARSQQTVWVRACGPTLRYWMETEVHVYAFSIAANVLLSFFPFLIIIVSLCRYALQWPAAENAIYLALSDFYPGPMGDFIVPQSPHHRELSRGSTTGIVFHPGVRRQRGL